MKFYSNKNRTNWKIFFAWLPIRAGTVGDRTITVWLEKAEWRYVPLNGEWANAAWECRPLNADPAFKSARLFEGVWV